MSTVFFKISNILHEHGSNARSFRFNSGNGNPNVFNRIGKITVLKLLVAAIFLISQSLMAQSPSTVWNIDKSHSSVGFSIDHLVISQVYGQFNDFSADVKTDKPDFTDVAVTFTIQTKSIDTKDDKRDSHLRSADFFDAEKFPVITFVGKKFVQVKGNQYKLTGDLTLHGVTKTVTLDAKFAVINAPYGNRRAGIQISGDIDRYEYDLKWNKAIEAGGLAVGQLVKLQISVELVKAK
jgi:polyisoprenoid-binding protein YceI